MFNKIDAYVILSEVNRFYFTGFRSSFGCVVLTEKENHFLTDKRYASEAKELVKDFRIAVSGGAGVFDDVAAILKNAGAKTVGYEDEYVTVAQFKRMKAALSGFTLKPASQDFAEKRLIKTEAEIARISTAQAVTQKALQRTVPLIKAGITEKELSDELAYQMLKLGAVSPSFETIVAFGVNTANPHHHPTNKKLEKNELITIDMGARVNGYCGDMTRTFSIGAPTQKLARIHSIVLEAQEYALQNIKAGMTCSEAHALAAEYITANGHGGDFTHSLGHGIGIEEHELPFVGPRSDMVLRENMVISVEPGIYVDGLGGTRIEDLVVVKDGGIVNITNFDKSINL